MLNSFKALKSGNLDQVNDNMLYPLLRWSSGSIQDLPWCAKVNQVFFFIPKEMQKSLLYIGLRDKNPFMKYPKGAKEKEDKTFELKKVLAKKYYSWSEQEFQRNLSVLDKINWLEVANALGCETKEYKILGLKEPKVINKPKEVIIPVKKAKTLLDF